MRARCRFTAAIVFFNLFLIIFPSVTAQHGSLNSRTSIVFTSGGRPNYYFDVYSLPLWTAPNEVQITDGESINFNGFFPKPSWVSMLFDLPNDSGVDFSLPLHLIYVTERHGSSSIFLDSIYYRGLHRGGSRSVLELHKAESTGKRVSTELARFQISLVGMQQSEGKVSVKDRPTLVGEYLIYVSTHENPGVPRTSWAAVYSTHLKTGLTRRLTPYGVADLSPAVSPSGLWTAVASFGEKGWGGEVQELGTDIYVFLTRDGSKRVKLVEHGGWPSWVDESTFYFHRRCEDGWWSVFKATLPGKGEFSVESVVTQRVTPPGLHAFTPAASVANKSFIAVATRRADSDFRHVELYDVVSGKFTALTRPIAPNVHHLNPFISPDSSRVGYHRCRGANNEQKNGNLILENLKNPIPNQISLFQFGGSFPTFSPDGARIAFVFDFEGVYIVNIDGSGLRKVFERSAFAIAWDRKREGLIYTSTGPSFASESAKVDIISIDVDDENLSVKELTRGGENNAFPSPSPDGKWIVFRSGRSGHKNLYVMDALEGEAGGIYRLTEGPWTDTMCNWSPDGVWIAFASDRENPGLDFSLFMVHPNGTGLHKLVQSGSGGRTNHPYFSPDGKYIVFTSDYAGVSAEPISTPHQYQPAGEIFVIKSDGSGLRRLTHNIYEDGTPSWGPTFMRDVDVNIQWPNAGLQCAFKDCHWLNIAPKIVKYGDENSRFPSASVDPQCPI